MNSALLQGWSLFDARSTLVGLVVFLVLFWLLRRRRPRHLPPGPLGWPLLGYLPQVAMSRDDPHAVFSKLASRYGSIISLNLAGNLVVVLHGHDAIKEAFQMQQLSARPRLYTSEKVRPGVGVITSSGDVWTELRRFSLTVLRGFGVGKSSFEEKISTEAEFLIDEWKKQGGSPFEPRHLVASAVSNVICSVVFGKRFEYSDQVFQRLLQVNDDIAKEAGTGGALEFSSFFASLTFLPFVKRYIQLVESSHRQMRSMVEVHSREFDETNLRDLIDTFLKQQAQAEKADAKSEVFNTENLINVVGDLFFAGSETTTTTLRWMLLYMMAYPEVQARVQKELDDVTSRNRFPRISDKPDLPYTEAVMSELQRINTIAPLAVPHVTSEDTTLLGYELPKGTIVVSNLWHCHFDPSIWDNPEEFKPERFLNDEGAFISRKELTPFGIGRRVCLGENLAKMEIFIFFTLLLHEFSFQKPPDSPPLSLRGINSGTFAPCEFKVCAIPRQ